MGINESKSIIHRKAQVARDGFDARVMSPAKALRLTLAKSADALLGLAVTVSMVEQLKIEQAGIQAELGDDGLLLLLDDEQGGRGALKVDLQMQAALIEVQTTGDVRKAVAAARPFTRTDAAIAAPLVNAVLKGFDQQMQSGMAEYEPLNFSFGDMIEDARTLSLALSAPDYDMFRVSVDIAQGAKTGMLTLLLPRRALAPPKTEQTGSPKSKMRGFKENAMNAPVVMDAAVARIRLPLHDVCAFKIGMQVPISVESLQKTQLLGARGHVVAEVCLGQLNGWRAVRLKPEDEDADLPESDDEPSSAEVSGQTRKKATEILEPETLSGKVTGKGKPPNDRVAAATGTSARGQVTTNEDAATGKAEDLEENLSA